MSLVVAATLPPSARDDNRIFGGGDEGLAAACNDDNTDFGGGGEGLVAACNGMTTQILVVAARDLPLPATYIYDNKDFGGGGEELAAAACMTWQHGFWWIRRRPAYQWW